MENVAIAYVNFAITNPALYEAMFVLPTDLRFAEAETQPQLRAAFDTLAAAVAPYCADVDAEAMTETYWYALHGLAELECAGRIRPGARAERIGLLVRSVVPGNRSPEPRAGSIR
ncbi:TetR-like C-terminal domain-containing protein [Paraburkholderia azotifigens]|uniref:TetR-like C-terminal domain-containing protein n=1 Tax=Paraburkholderia azotifigens TaxID=2057004 RepID=UPI001F03051C|nr:TetR-like C-terminal domain-containing protein [Paraburkholderia azotifigens]